MKLGKAMGGLILILGTIGLYVVGELIKDPQAHGIIVPEESFYLWPALIGCAIVAVFGIIVLSGWWQRFPTGVVIIHVCIFITGFGAIYIGYITGNNSPIKVTVSVLGAILVIMASAAVFRRKYSTNRKALTGKFTAVLLLLLLLVIVVWVVVPHRVDAVATSFPDPNLRAAVRDAMGKKYIGYARHSDLGKLTKLETCCEPIRNLTGLQYCTSLTELNLGVRVFISDLTPISNLTGLTRLGLSYNSIRDVTPLSHLTNLTDLQLSSNEISDISPLANLTALRNLDLYGNQISDISPLIKLTSLKTLDLRGNPLNAESVNVYLPELKQRGVRVDY